MCLYLRLSLALKKKGRRGREQKIKLKKVISESIKKKDFRKQVCKTSEQWFSRMNFCLVSLEWTLIEPLPVNIRFLLLIKLRVVFICFKINTFKGYMVLACLLEVDQQYICISLKSLSKQAHTGKNHSVHVV